VYQAFYNLNSIPFRLTPDARFFFASESHEHAYAYLQYALQRREGYVVISGASGTGKTELLEKLISDISTQSFISIKRITALQASENILDRLAELILGRQVSSNELSSNEAESDKIKILETFLVRERHNHRHVLLLIDEANNLSLESLASLAQLSELVHDENPLLQCFLFGKDELITKLELPELRQLKQKILIVSQLENLDLQDTKRYIEYRLACSGWKNDPAIDEAVYGLIHQFTSGVPRTINVLCSRLLVESCLDHKHNIDIESTSRIINEMQEEILVPRQTLDLDFSKYGKLTIDNELERQQKSATQTRQNKSQHDEKRRQQEASKDMVTADIVEELSAEEISHSAIKNDKIIHQPHMNLETTSYLHEFVNSTQDIIPPDLADTIVDQAEQTQAFTPQSFVPPRDDLNHNTQILTRDMPHRSQVVKKITPSNRLKPSKSVKRRESGLLDKDLRALASCLEQPMHSASDTADSSQADSAATSFSDKPTVKIILNGYMQVLVQWFSGKKKYVPVKLLQLFSSLDRFIDRLPVSRLGLIISVSILIVLWWFVYGPGLQLVLGLFGVTNK